MEPTKNVSVVRNNALAHRFEKDVQGGTAVLDYRLDGSTLYLTHAGVPPPARGGGIAAEVTLAALEWARAQGWKVVPVCSYVAAYMHSHPEFSDLRE